MTDSGKDEPQWRSRIAICLRPMASGAHPGCRHPQTTPSLPSPAPRRYGGWLYGGINVRPRSPPGGLGLRGPWRNGRRESLRRHTPEYLGALREQWCDEMFEESVLFRNLLGMFRLLCQV
jgi:hypothetical protein